MISEPSSGSDQIAAPPQIHTEGRQMAGTLGSRPSATRPNTGTARKMPAAAIDEIKARAPQARLSTWARQISSSAGERLDRGFMNGKRVVGDVSTLGVALSTCLQTDSSASPAAGMTAIQYPWLAQC